MLCNVIQEIICILHHLMYLKKQETNNYTLGSKRYFFCSVVKLSTDLLDINQYIKIILKNNYIYIIIKKFIVLSLSPHSSSSPGVESNQSNVTCFNLIRSHQTCLLVLVRQQEVRESSACSHWMDSRVTSTQPTVCLWRN